MITEESIAAVEDAGAPRERRLSYNHTRDNRFQSFQDERHSPSNPFSTDADIVNQYNLQVPHVMVGDHDLEAYEMDSTRRSLR
jgi:hypothetical protein